MVMRHAKLHRTEPTRNINCEGRGQQRTPCCRATRWSVSCTNWNVRSNFFRTSASAFCIFAAMKTR